MAESFSGAFRPQYSPIRRNTGRPMVTANLARRHESLIPLSHEHHDALLLAWRLRTGDWSNKREPELRAKHVSAFFEYRLIQPFRQIEEDLLFPACRAVLGVEATLIDVPSSGRPSRASSESLRRSEGAGAHVSRWTVSAFCSSAISGPRSVNCSCWRRIG